MELNRVIRDCDEKEILTPRQRAVSVRLLAAGGRLHDVVANEAKQFVDLDIWRGKPLRDWRVTEERMARGKNPIFMHCLPVRRNVVVDDVVLDGPRSVVLDEAENRLYAQQAILEWLAEGKGR